MSIVPYKIKSVEKIRLIPRAERLRKIKEAGYNLFFLNSEDVYIDLLTDSGTGAMSDEQWSAMMRGDESYAGSKSFRRFQKAVKDVFGFPHVIPAHQGRGAENVFNEVMVKRGMLVPGNAHFDTTRAHIEYRGGIAVDCTIKEAKSVDSYFFKGNVDLEKLEKVLKSKRKRVAYILLTITCNSVGGQPVSMKNIANVSQLAKKYGVKLFFDIARFAENAFFIKELEPAYKNSGIPAITRKIMSYADGVLMSAKKDAIANIGGFIEVREKSLYDALAPVAILMEGFLHYGGLAGRDLEAIAVGLYEAIDEENLRYRIGQVRYLGMDLHLLAGVPVILPIGGHAVYVDAGKFLPHIPASQFPGHSLAISLYKESGVRSVEIGSLMAGHGKKAPMELLRLAVPWRTYTKEHLDYVVSAFGELASKKDKISGVKFSYESPILRHFSSRFTLVSP